MRKKISSRLQLVNLVFDLSSVLVAGLLSLIIRFGFDWSGIDYLWYLGAFCLVAFLDVLILYFSRAYDSVYRSLLVEIPKLFRAQTYSFAIFLIMTFFIRWVSFSRLSIGYFLILSFLLQLMGKLTFHYIKKSLYKKGYGTMNVLFVGCSEQSVEIANHLRKHPEFGYRVVGCVVTDTNGPRGGIKRIGTIKNFEKAVKEQSISTVIIGVQDRGYIESLLSFCEANYLQVYIIPDILDLTAGGIETGQINNIPLLKIKESMLSPMQWKLKRIFDLGVAVIALIVLSPLFLLVGLLIKLSSPGPVFFAHRRLGHNNTPINVYKFRTMVMDAEELLQDMLRKDPELKEEFYRDFKLKDDPRITKIGKFLRKTSLDELPQIFNIIKGEMSWVGPRPIVQEEIARYGDYAKIILRVPPGITGYWQTNGRNDVDYEERIKLDIYYINNWSLLMDFMIMLRTIPKVIRKKGAY